MVSVVAVATVVDAAGTAAAPAVAASFLLGVAVGVVMKVHVMQTAPIASYRDA